MDMTRLAMSLAAAAALGALSSCDGPSEQSGELIDNSTGAVESEDTLRSGPAETLGERQDEARESAGDAADARADALEKQADAGRAAAEQNAEVLEQEADRVRGQ
jgi:hypothetical protein